MKRNLLCLVMTWLTAAGAYGQLNVGSDGSDGSFVFVGEPGNANLMLIDLSLATTATWDTPSPDPGKGVYDPDKWAVVFKYTDVTIPSGKTVGFKHHPSRAPVVWLVQGDVTISGTLSLTGANGHTCGVNVAPTRAAAGGFRGGRGKLSGSEGSAGFGPGGAEYNITHGNHHGSGGSYGFFGGRPANAGAVGPTYGNEHIIPLIGGSGGASGRWTSSGAGGGGGAILIAADNGITVNGLVRANGGSRGGGCLNGGGGSGGAIRLVADAVMGFGTLQALGGTGTSGGNGGAGRIRIEANSIAFTASNPAHSFAAPDPLIIWPPSTAPTLRPTMLTFIDPETGLPVIDPETGLPVEVLIPEDPRASLNFPSADVEINWDDLVALTIEATNVPTDWDMIVRVVPKSGQDVRVPAMFISGDEVASTWEADLDISDGFSAIQVRAARPPSP